MCEGRKGRSSSKEEQLSARQVGNSVTVRMRHLCRGCWESSGCGHPAVSLSFSLHAAQLGAGGSINMRRRGNVAQGVTAHGVGPGALLVSAHELCGAHRARRG